MNDKRNKLLLFTSIYPLPWLPNKATFNFQQYSHLTDQHDVEFLVPVPWLDWLKHLFRLMGQHDYKHVCYFPFFYIPGIFRGLNSFFLVLSIIISVIPLFKLLRAKVVLASWAFPDGLACAWLKNICRYRLYIQCLGSDVNVHSENKFRRGLLKSAFKISDGVITVSKALQKKVIEISPTSNVKTIYNGVNFERFTPRDEKFEETSIIFIGNLIKTKGVYELMSAAEQLLTSGKKYKFHIIGNGPERGPLEAIVKEQNLGSSITIHGTVNHSEVVNFLQSSHLLLLPSYQEGVPNVIMESLACGVPVVATKVGGIPEVVDERNGILINSYHSRDIVKGIQLCLSKEWRGMAIRATIKEYTWRENIKQLSGFLFKS